MKIGHPSDTPATPPNGSASAPTGSSSAAPAPNAAAPSASTAIPAKADDSAKIRLSNAATSLLEGGGSTPEFDADKVARISRSIEDGSFKIDPGAIADKLIANAKELLPGSGN